MSRQQSVLRNTVGYMLKNIDNQATNGEEKSKPEVIKLGLDLHARQVTECRQLDGSTPKPAQQWDPWKLLDKVEEWVKAGSKVYSCYEAGPCGYWYHRELTKLGAVNYVVALSWITLQLEIRGWERFHNRRQVASYTGLCPGIHNSNGR